jgi:UDP-N-acetylmuramate: L-alanyl-gamma-D-glutamyl-meso-diaminopimelate ligase
VEFDHADIYRDLDEIKTAFRRLVNLVPRRGLVVRYEESPISVEVTSGALSRVEGYGVDHGRWRALDVRETERGSAFRVDCDGAPFCEIEMDAVGGHNIRNALAVVAAAREQGLSAEEISAGLGSFRGVRRRLELRGEAFGVRVLDDFAHHPTAILETLAAVRRRYPKRRVWAVLEPRSWSLRRSVFQERLSLVFDDADETVIARVYGDDAVPADQRLDAERVVAGLRARGRSARYVPQSSDIVELIAGTASAGDVVVVMSNGAFDSIHERLLEALRERAAAGTETSRSAR